MSSKKLFSRIHYLFVAVLTTVVLVACGGGGSGGGGGGGAADTLFGTAATGAPLDGVVYVTDSSGAEASAPIAADGSFTVVVEGMSAPFMVRAVPSVGDTLYSYVNAKNITVNVTPLTHLAVFLAYEQGDLDALYSAWNSLSSQLTDFEILNAKQIINANLSDEYSGMLVDATRYDFMHTAFSADGAGIDGVMDGLIVTVNLAGSTFTITDSDLFSVAFDVNIDTSAIQIDFTNSGVLAIDPASTWQLTITDTANNIPPTAILVTGLEVPADPAELQSLSEDDFAGSVISEGLTIDYSFTGVSYDVTGAGGTGTTISGQVSGTVHVSGVVNGQGVNETVTINSTFEWERIA